MARFDEEIHAFIDGSLDKARAREFERALAGDAALNARVDAYRADKDMLRDIFGGVEAMPVPEAWTARIEKGVAAAQASPANVTAFGARRGRHVPASMMSARNAVFALAASLLIVLGAYLSFQTFSAPGDEAIIAEAVRARQDILQPQQQIAAAAMPAPEQRDKTVSDALAMDLKTPDLGKLGFELASIKIYGGVPGGKSVELDYRDGQNRAFTLYLRKPTDAPRVDMIERDGGWICIWQDDVLGSVMQADVSAGEMARLASLAYAGLEL